MKAATHWTAVMLLCPSFAAAVAASDPTVCDGLKGQEAYGLCNAYCEALDCDWDPHASAEACEAIKSNYQQLTGDDELPCEQMSLGCILGDSGMEPPSPFNVGDGNDYGSRALGATVPQQCECDGEDDCTPCPIVIGYHGYGGSGPTSWKWKLEPKGNAVGYISVYPTGDITHTNYFYGPDTNWAVPSCQNPMDGCRLVDNIPCDWCGDITEEDNISTQREVNFTRAIIKWIMENHCVDPGQIFGTGYSNGGLMVHLLARHPETSGLFKALIPVDGVDQAGMDDHLRWIRSVSGNNDQGSSSSGPRNAPWIMHANEIFDRFEPYDGMDYTDFAGNEGGGWNPVWIYPPVLQIFAHLSSVNIGYEDCGFGTDDVGDRNGMLDVGGIVPEGYRRLEALEGEGQTTFHCFTKDAEGKTCEKLAICLWDTQERGDDIGDTHYQAFFDWAGGTDPGTGGTDPMDIMWRFFQWSANNP